MYTPRARQMQGPWPVKRLRAAKPVSRSSAESSRTGIFIGNNPFVRRLELKTAPIVLQSARRIKAEALSQACPPATGAEPQQSTESHILELASHARANRHSCLQSAGDERLLPSARFACS